MRGSDSGATGGVRGHGGITSVLSTQYSILSTQRPVPYPVLSTEYSEAIRKVVLPQMVAKLHSRCFLLGQENTHADPATEGVCDGPHGRTMGDLGTFGSASQAWRARTQRRHARGHQHDLVPQPVGLPVGHVAARSFAQEHRLR